MRLSLKDIAADSLSRFGQKEKRVWLEEDPAQITLLINMVNWVIAVEQAFKNNNLKKALDDQKALLTDLIKMVQGDLSRPMRQKIACLITMDAHSRDIIAKLINLGVTEVDHF